MDRYQKLALLKNLTYIILMVLCYIAQVTPGLFSVLGAAPLLTVGLMVPVAMYEGEMAGGLYGLFAGVLCDAGATYFFGLGSALFLVAGVAVGLLILILVRNSIKSAAILIASVSGIYSLANYFFLYGLWGYEKSYLYFLYQSVPTVIYTTAFGAILYLAVRAIHIQFEKKAEQWPPPPQP